MILELSFQSLLMEIFHISLGLNNTVNRVFRIPNLAKDTITA